MKWMCSSVGAAILICCAASGQSVSFTECGSISVDADCTLLVTDAGDRYELIGVGASAVGDELKVHGFIQTVCDGACEDVVACVLVSNINPCDGDDDEGEDEAEGEDEDEDEGQPEFFDCAYRETFAAEWPLMAADLELTPNHSEFPGQHIPLRWGLAMAQMLLCKEGHPHHEEALAVYEANLAALEAESMDVLDRVEPFKSVLAAALLLGPVRQAWLVDEYGLMNAYGVVGPQTKSTGSSLLSDDGDLDKDGVSNADEYAHIVAQGGGVGEFVMFADSAQFNSQLIPAADGVGLTVLVLAIVLVWISRRRQTSR